MSMASAKCSWSKVRLMRLIGTAAGSAPLVLLLGAHRWYCCWECTTGTAAGSTPLVLLLGAHRWYCCCKHWWYWCLLFLPRCLVAMPGKQLFGKCWEHPEPTEGGILSPYEQETHNTLSLYSSYINTCVHNQ